MNTMRQGGGQQPGGPPPSGPAGSPMPKPQEAEGKKAQAMAVVSIAVSQLENALLLFGSSSDEGAAILKSLGGLSKISTKRDSNELIPAELQQLIQNSQSGEQQKQMMMQMMQQKGGGAPPGGPPGAPPGQPPMMGA